jgi:hypothetical protein
VKERKKERRGRKKEREEKMFPSPPKVIREGIKLYFANGKIIKTRVLHSS